jgi:hypothetical protein
VIISWLSAENDDARKRINELLDRLGTISTILEEQLDGMDVGPDEIPRGTSGREILEALPRFI